MIIITSLKLTSITIIQNLEFFARGQTKAKTLLERENEELKRSNKSLDTENANFIEQLEKSCALCSVPDRLRLYAETEFKYRPKMDIQKGLIFM